jgi:uncharacterized protein YyaL (SSP411 family)
MINKKVIINSIIGASMARILNKKNIDIRKNQKKNIKNNKKPNKLITEKSPYLLQHAYNPVNWHAWNGEAFEKAKREDKPIFLSIGYSTCHWCHVMEQESFEDEEVAKLMNDAFISIKVDREERPDIDSVYMSVCQTLTGGGGWPLSIIMTPDKKPFFAGTYIPKEPRFNQPGMIQLTKMISEMWDHKKDEIITSSENIVSTLQEPIKQTIHVDFDETILSKTYNQLYGKYDVGFGGFGGAPKFPEPHNLMFLLRYWKRTGDENALSIVEHTLDYMRRGGIFDHIGFGFHRYSTDRQWLVPHFEKMLYDQALLALAYIEAFQATGNEFYKNTANEIFTYVLRDLHAPNGAFYSADDADSDGEEGKFYVWSFDELNSILDKEDLDFVTKIFNIERTGNYNEPYAKKRTNANILHRIKSKSKLLKELDLTEVDFDKKLEKIRSKLFANREKRNRPHNDDKILTDWNGLMIAALAKGAQVFSEDRYNVAAKRAADFILSEIRSPDGGLMHRYRNGESAINGFINDYVFLIWGLIELYEANFESKYLDTALELTDEIINKFWDETNGGFFFTSEDHEKLFIRKKENFDGAIPSGNSVAFLNLIRLSRLAKKPDLEKKAKLIIKSISDNLKQIPSAFTQLLMGLDYAFGPSYEVLIEGDLKAKETQEMIKALRTHFIPNKVVLLNARAQQQAKEMFINLPDPGKDPSLSVKTKAYVCVNYSCQKPTTNINEMLSQLEVRI